MPEPESATAVTESDECLHGPTDGLDLVACCRAQATAAGTGAAQAERESSCKRMHASPDD